MHRNASSHHIALYGEVTRVTELPRHHNNAIRLFDRYWNSLCDELGKLPSRKNLDPVAMGPRTLPWMLIVELHRDDEGIFFHYRLCGTEIAALIGRDITGKSTREVISGDNLKIITDPYFYTLEVRQPGFWQTSVFHETYRWRPAVRGVWPLAEDGTTIDMFVNLTVPVQG